MALWRRSGGGLHHLVEHAATQLLNAGAAAEVGEKVFVLGFIGGDGGRIHLFLVSHDREQLLFAVLRASAATCYETTVGGDDEETNEGHDEAVGHGRVVGNQSHEHGSHGTADDAHDEQ